MSLTQQEIDRLNSLTFDQLIDEVVSEDADYDDDTIGTIDLSYLGLSLDDM